MARTLASLFALLIKFGTCSERKSIFCQTSHRELPQHPHQTTPSFLPSLHPSLHPSLPPSLPPSLLPSLSLFIPPSQMDTGFCVWSFQGRLLYRNPVQVDKFCQLLWRPRPPSLLTEDDLKVWCNFKLEMAKTDCILLPPLPPLPGCQEGTEEVLLHV